MTFQCPISSQPAVFHWSLENRKREQASHSHSSLETCLHRTGERPWTPVRSAVAKPRIPLLGALWSRVRSQQTFHKPSPLILGQELTRQAPLTFCNCPAPRHAASQQSATREAGHRDVSEADRKVTGAALLTSAPPMCLRFATLWAPHGGSLGTGTAWALSREQGAAGLTALTGQP